MSLLDALLSALQSLRANFLRSILTMLGIVIGVAAVVTMIAIGTGAETSVRQSMQRLGTNILVISPGSSSFRGARGGAGTEVTLTLADADAIAESVDHIVVVASTVDGQAQLVAGNLNWATRITGTTTGIAVARDWTVESGRFLSDADVRGATKVAIIGATVAENLFPGQDPVGRAIRIDRVPFKVVGLLAAKGQSGFGMDQDDVVFIPITTAKRRLLGRGLSGDEVSNLTIKVDQAQWMSAVEEQARQVLRLRHRLAAAAEDDFRIRNLAEMQETSAEMTRIMTLLLSAIASVSLLVGGIGIMNIMLVSVTERTREIGLRVAVGARRRDIQAQFLIEAVVLSLIGGLIGIFLGSALAVMIARLAGWAVNLPVAAALLAFGFAAAIGIGFGFFPAHRAARLNPIEALRYE